LDCSNPDTERAINAEALALGLQAIEIAIRMSTPKATMVGFSPPLPVPISVKLI
jgi:hypothetical protein